MLGFIKIVCVLCMIVPYKAPLGWSEEYQNMSEYMWILCESVYPHTCALVDHVFNRKRI
jgi:hypothetical protein